MNNIFSVKWISTEMRTLRRKHSQRAEWKIVLDRDVKNPALFMVLERILYYDTVGAHSDEIV